MIHRIITLLCFISVIPTLLFGQHNRCGHDRVMQELFEDQLGYEKSIEEGFKAFNVKQNLRKKQAPDVVVIPVHVIIVHPTNQSTIGQGNNLSEARVLSQIQATNKDFRRLNPDSINTPAVFDVGDTYIEFAMAQIDPMGNPTNGITRYATDDDFDTEELNIKAATRWDRDTYLNIWVAPTLDDLGFATVPSINNLANVNRDGCAILTPAFGGPGFATFVPYHLGRTVTHEIGHYLGLRHIWRSNGCGNDDGITDTPQQDSSHFACPTHPLPSCGNNGDMFMNYMDYVNDNCMNAFSLGQGAYMREILNTSRSSLLTAADRALTDPNEVLAIAFDSIVDPDCYDTFSGLVRVSATGGAGNYRFKINGGPSQSSPTFNFLKAGPYEVEVFDNLGANLSVSTTLVDPPELRFTSLDPEDAECGRGLGNLSVDAEGGTVNATYSYTLSTGISSLDGRFTDVLPGGYEITVTDDNNCQAVESVQINAPDSLFLSILRQENIDCNNILGSLEIEIEGGTEPYQKRLNGTLFENDIIEDLGKGVYTIEVIDANDCLQEINVEIEELEVIDITEVTNVGPTCFGDSNGSLSIVTSTLDNVDFRLDQGSVQSSPNFENLDAGTYRVYALLGSCVDSMDVMIEEGLRIDLQVEIQDQINCPLDESGSILLSSSANIQSFGLNNETQSNGLFTDLSAGSYTAVISSEEGCSTDTIIDLRSNNDLNIDILVDEITCHNLSDGALEINGLGGVGAYSFSINGNTFGTSNRFFGYAPGKYQAYVKDEDGCIMLDSFELIAPDSLYIEDFIESLEGNVEVVPQGGTPPYTFSKDNITYQDDAIFSSNQKGEVLEIYLKDANDCIAMSSYLVTDLDEQSLDSFVKFYPNPAHDHLFLERNNDENNMDIRMYSSLGVLVFEKEGFNSNSINLDELDSGVYFIHVQSEGHIAQETLLIVK